MQCVFDSLFTLTCFCVVVLISSLYIYLRHSYNYWKTRGVKCVEPLPLIGNYDRFILSQANRSLVADTLYKKYPREKYFGLFHFRSPVLIMRDPILIQKILTSDFDYFQDRAFAEKVTIFNHLLALTGNKWENFRQKLTPLFRLEKLKTILKELKSCSKYFDELVGEKVVSENVFDICEVMSKFTMNMITSIAFGCEMNSLKGSDQDVFREGQELFRFSFLSVLDSYVESLDTKLSGNVRNILDIKTMPKYVQDFYLNFLKISVAYREKHNLKRNDFLQLLINLKNEECSLSRHVCEKNCNIMSKDCSDDSLLTSNVCIFLTAGFETISYTLSICLLELADNLDVQRKLRDEISTTIGKNNNNLTYQALNDMKYMDKVISETLRKYPVAIGLIRVCTKNYRIPGSDIVIEKGIPVYIPVYSIHRDPEYYINPETFDPERFSVENIEERQSGTYLPFGAGPRSCIGSQFALLQMKVALSHIISLYKFTMTNKTVFPLEFSARSAFLAPKNGIWLKVHKI